MSQIARGSFVVELTPEGEPLGQDGVTLGRMSLAKRFEGDLAATGEGVMLTATTPVQGSAGYVAIERVRGSLHGRAGSFVLQHSGSMQAGAQQLSISVVPDSGTGALLGLSGRFQILNEGAGHGYEMSYSLPA